MRSSLSILLAILVLLQATSRAWILAGYELNQPEIARLLCVNKARPQMNCQGKCFLKKQLQKAQETDQKSKKTLSFPLDDFIPAASLPGAVQQIAGVTPFAAFLPNLYALLRSNSVFHPPCE
jgi:hypothetical protein